MANLPPATFVIESEDFIIRPMLPGDASEKLGPWIEDENSAAMLNTHRRNWDIAQQAELFSRHEAEPTRRILGIFPKRAKDPIGLFIVKVTPKHGVFLLSHLIGDKDWRGKDTTFQTSEAVYDYFFNTLGYAKAKANVRPENKPMLWLIYTYVWRKEAHLIKHLRLADSGKRSDLLTFAILAEEWRNRADKFRSKPRNGEAAASGAPVGAAANAAGSR